MCSKSRTLEETSFPRICRACLVKDDCVGCAFPPRELFVSVLSLENHQNLAIIHIRYAT